jgi:hypothetical protein
MIAVDTYYEQRFRLEAPGHLTGELWRMRALEDKVPLFIGPETTSLRELRPIIGTPEHDPHHDSLAVRKKAKEELAAMEKQWEKEHGLDSMSNWQRAVWETVRSTKNEIPGH